MFESGGYNIDKTTWFHVVSLISVVGYILLALAIYCNKELQIHPMRLFFVMSLVDAAVCLLVYEAGNVCTWNLYEFFAATVFFSEQPQAQYRALWILQATKNYFAILCMFTTIMLNTCLAVDLILMIKHPFKIKEKRTQVYIALSFAVAFLMTTAWAATLNYYPDPKWGTWPLPNRVVIVCAYVILVSYLLLAFTSIFYAFTKLCRAGISKQSRQLVFLRHVLSIVGFILA
jgi:hypothetical protein